MLLYHIDISLFIQVHIINCFELFFSAVNSPCASLIISLGQIFISTMNLDKGSKILLAVDVDKLISTNNSLVNLSPVSDV